MGLLNFLFGKRHAQPEEDAFDIEAFNRKHLPHYHTMSDEELAWAMQFDSTLTKTLADWTGRGDFRYYGADTGHHHYYAWSEMFEDPDYIVAMNERGEVSIVEEVPGWQFCDLCDEYRPPSHFPHEEMLTQCHQHRASG